MNRVPSPLLRARLRLAEGKGSKLGRSVWGFILDTPSPAWLRGRSKPPCYPMNSDAQSCDNRASPPGGGGGKLRDESLNLEA